MLRRASPIVRQSLKRSTTSRLLSTRPHPLSTPTPISTSAKSSTSLKSKQQFSALNGILLATLTGAITYAIGVQSQKETVDPKKSYREPTQDGFNKAMKELEWLPSDCITTDRDSLLAHGHSSWSHLNPTGLPGAVIYPRSTEDVVRIVKIASEYAIPLIPFSGGTSLEGHTNTPGYASNPSEAVAQAKLSKGEKVLVDDLVSGLAWSLNFSENMGQIIKINADDLDCVVQPGVSYDALNATLKEDGIPLFFPVDPCPGAQIGGMVGTGASGTNAVRYGTMRENVINLTVVLPSGEVIKTRQRAKKSSVGPDLTKLFVGSEGTFGIIVEATLKLYPVLPTTVAVVSFPTVQDAADAVRDIIQQGVGVSCVELMDDQMMMALNKKGGARSWPETPTLFFKFGGTDAQLKSDIDQTKMITKKNKGSNFTFAKNAREAEDIWYSRKMALYAAIDYVPGSRCWVTDVCVPISALPKLIDESVRDIREQGIFGPIVAHAGDGNFHSLLVFENDEELEKVKGIVHRMVERAQKLDGTASGEHGVGSGKRPYIEAELGAGTVNLLRNVKEMLDPQRIFNPGKLIPDRKDGKDCGGGNCLL